ASRSALTTCRPRKPVPPITAITPMPLVYEHVHNYASTIRNREREGGSDLAVNTHGTPAVRWELGFGSLDVPPDPKRGEGGLERGLGGDGLERAPPDAEGQGAQREQPEQAAVDRARGDFGRLAVAR